MGFQTPSPQRRRRDASLGGGGSSASPDGGGTPLSYSHYGAASLLSPPPPQRRRQLAALLCSGGHPLAAADSTVSCNQLFTLYAMAIRMSVVSAALVLHVACVVLASLAYHLDNDAKRRTPCCRLLSKAIHAGVACQRMKSHRH